MASAITQLGDRKANYKPRFLKGVVTRICKQSDLLNENLVGCHVKETPEIKRFRERYKIQHERLVRAFDNAKLIDVIDYDQWPTEAKRNNPKCTL